MESELPQVLGRRERIAPCRCRIPGILHGRIVVCSDAVDQRHAAEVQSVGIAYVEIVPGEQMRRRRAKPLRVIGALNKGADMIGDGASIEKTRGLQLDIVI